MNFKKTLFMIAMTLMVVAMTGCKKGDDPSGLSVKTTGPNDNAVGVSRAQALTIEFSTEMNPATINTTTFTVTKGGAPVAGTVTYSGKTATFTPTATLAAGALYTATITTGAKDLSGNSLASAKVWSFTTGGSTIGLMKVDLGAALDYAILAKSSVANAATSAITGDLGLSPAATSYYTGFSEINATGFATSAQVVGKLYAADMAAPTPINLTTAVTNMITAYNDAAGRPSPDFTELGTGNIGGKTLVPGLYKWTTNVTIPTTVTLSGSATDVWIFQTSGNLTMAADVNITLAGAAQAKNIFWQVAGQATIGARSHFEGVILSMTGITMETNAVLHGAALAQTAVILDQNTVTEAN